MSILCNGDTKTSVEADSAHASSSNRKASHSFPPRFISKYLPKFAWNCRGDVVFCDTRSPYITVPIRQLISLIPFVCRCLWIRRRELNAGRRPFIDVISPRLQQPVYGVSCGSIGSGSIGRTFTGRFCRFSLRPGLVEESIIDADQFIVTISRGGRTIFCRGLSACEVAGDSHQHFDHVNNNDFKHCRQTLQTWLLDFPPENIHYTALFPRSWTIYKIPGLRIWLVCRQISPVIAGDYKDSSLPVTIFVWSVINREGELSVPEEDDHEFSPAFNDLECNKVVGSHHNGYCQIGAHPDGEVSEATDLRVSITFTFRNGIGLNSVDTNGKCSSKVFHDELQSNVETVGNKTSMVHGVSLSQDIDGMPCTYSISTRYYKPVIQTGKFVVGSNETDTDADSIHREKLENCGKYPSQATTSTTRTFFNPNGDGSDIWHDLTSFGYLPPENGAGASGKIEEVDEMGVAICASVLSPNGSQRTMEFCLAWDMPKIHFQGRRRTYNRRYTRFFGSDGDQAVTLTKYAFSAYPDWERRISEWQDSIQMSSSLPAWYKSALFNELYYLSDGGTVWVEYDESWRADEPTISDYSAAVMRHVGRFAYLESWEYRMFNTYDVHFYASYALALLWPRLEHSLQSDFVDQIFRIDDEPTNFTYDNLKGIVKRRGCVPHDLGDPFNDPWVVINAYRMHDTSEWRDLNLKFILATYRDFVMLSESEEAGGKSAAIGLLIHSWPAVVALLEHGLVAWDSDGDMMIENSNVCDQTYDAWIMHGTSAYCGGLWLGALVAGIAMAGLLGHDDEETKWKKVLRKARDVYVMKLWTGKFFKFDEFSPSRESIMADQLCGCWAMRAAGLDEGAAVAKQQIRTSLRTIYQNNVCAVAEGTTGVVNGVDATTGKIDSTSVQSHEIWTGVTYAVAAHMISEGMEAEGFHTASGIYRSCFGSLGLQFQTPEAIYPEHFFRACGYMRPLAIWAMQWALIHKDKK